MDKNGIFLLQGKNENSYFNLGDHESPFSSSLAILSRSFVYHITTLSNEGI